jgi:hypothetical protein
VLFVVKLKKRISDDAKVFLEQKGRSDMPGANQDKDQALAELAQRRQKSQGEVQIDDSSLPAGSPMHIYCRCCGQLARQVPEDYRPSQISYLCTLCENLAKNGWITKDQASGRWDVPRIVT